MANITPLSDIPRPFESTDTFGDKNFFDNTKETDDRTKVTPPNITFPTSNRPLEGRAINMTFDNSKGKIDPPTESEDQEGDGRVSVQPVPLPLTNTHRNSDLLPMNLLSNSPALSNKTSTQLISVTKIEDLEEFILSGLKQKSLSLDEGALALEQLEVLYRQANQQDNHEESQRVKVLMDQLRPIVDETNKLSNVFTARDRQLLTSFFSTPLESSYTDLETGQTYLLPDNSQLLKLATTAWVATDCYSGIEISKLYKVEDYSKIQAHSQEGSFSNLCDVIFFQCLEERVPLFKALKEGWADFTNYCSITKKSKPEDTDKNRVKMEQQRQVLLKAHQYLQNIYLSWGYLGFCTLETEEQLLTLNLPAGNAKKYQAICLFLNPEKQEETLSTERL